MQSQLHDLILIHRRRLETTIELSFSLDIKPVSVCLPMVKSKSLLKYVAWTLAVLLVLAIATRLLLAPLARGAIVDFFAAQGVEASVDDLNFELVDGKARLVGLSAAAAGKPVFAVGRFELAWSWSALSENRLRIESVQIDGLDIEIQQDEDGGMTIAGIDLPAAGGEAETPTTDESAEPLAWTLELARFGMNDTRVCYRAPEPLDYCNRMKALSWNGELAFDLAELEGDALPLRASGDLNLAAFESRSNVLNRVLTSFDSLALDEIAIDTDAEIAIGTVTVESLKLFERVAKDDTPFIEQVDKLTIRDTRVTNGRLLTVAEIEVLGNATELVISETEGFELNGWLAALGRPPQAAAAGQVPATGTDPAVTANDANATSGDGEAAADVPAEEAFAFSLGRFAFVTEKPLQYRDLSLGKPFTLGVSTTELVLEKLDSREPEQPSTITYQAKLDGDSLFKLEGTATPLADKISFDIDGEIRALDLRRLSPFTASSIGHTIKSGQLDADIDLRAEQAIVNGKIDLVLYRFDLQPLSEADAAEMEKQFGFPLGVSLSLLKNREGNIELNVPLSGDLENPDFGTGKIVSRELSKAITSAVLTFYTPFGMVTAADALFNLATALKFEPVEFAAGDSEIDDADLGSLDRIATLMQERPGIQLRVCPYTNSADRAALLPTTAHTEASDLKLASSQLALLIELGEARFAAVEKYLADKGADPARVIPCTASHQEGEGLAGVEISI